MPNKKKTPSLKPSKPASNSAGAERGHPTDAAPIIPGEILLGDDDVVAFAGRPHVTLTVANHGDRPIQVGSHCHFFEVNRALRFDRKRAFGFRLNVPSGTAVRFEPGEEKRVELVAFGGNRIAYGINGLTNGALDDEQVKVQAFRRAVELGFLEEGAS